MGICMSILSVILVVTLHNNEVGVPVICTTYLTFLDILAISFSHCVVSFLSLLFVLSFEDVAHIKSPSSINVVILTSSSLFEIYSLNFLLSFSNCDGFIKQHNMSDEFIASLLFNLSIIPLLLISFSSGSL